MTAIAANGCTSADLIAAIAAAAANHDEFMSGVTKLTNAWVSADLITRQQMAAIVRAAAQADIPWSYG